MTVVDVDKGNIAPLEWTRWQDGTMDLQIVTTVVCALLIGVGIMGVIVPVLPGSLLVAASLLIWALSLQSATGWVVFASGFLLVLVGMTASAVLTGRTMKRRKIPNRSILAGLVLGIAGMFVIPVVGLFVGFALGLFLSEFARQQNIGLATSSSLAALKATGVGILVELACALTAGTLWVIGAWVYFINV